MISAIIFGISSVTFALIVEHSQLYIIFHFPTDIDECSTGAHTCHRNKANCINIEGGYTCQCKLGYTGDGRICNGKTNFCVITAWKHSEVSLTELSLSASCGDKCAK